MAGIESEKNTTPDGLAEAEDFLRHAASRHPLVTVVTASGANLAPAQTDVPATFRHRPGERHRLAQTGV
ncbi:hypothetical protein AB0O67_25440 [Streptomyces sp. NPDC086077]|uniref:hypothetical protein n=1 Tax=Streptomyces sp. NPDC086077 TaxID=3154862 RepID=UPI0034419E46